MPLSLDTNRHILPRRTLLYGPGGIGKTTWASRAPGVIFLPTEEGTNDLPPEVARFPLCLQWDQMMHYLGELAQEPHEFRSLCLDTVDWAEKLAWQKVCQEAGVEQVGDIKYGRGYGFAAQHFRNLCSALDYLRNTRGMDVILLAHAKVEKFEDPEHPSYDRYQPKLHDHVTNLLIEWCDEVFFADFKKIVQAEDAGFNRTIGKGKTTGQRIMRCTARPAAMAKNRLAMPDEISFDFSEYSKFRQF